MHVLRAIWGRLTAWWPSYSSDYPPSHNPHYLEAERRLRELERRAYLLELSSRMIQGRK